MVFILLFLLFIFSVFVNYDNINTIGFFQRAELRYLTFIVPILSILWHSWCVPRHLGTTWKHLGGVLDASWRRLGSCLGYSPP